MSMKRAAASGSLSTARRAVSAAERTAVMGVRSSCDTLATKSLRIVSSRRISVTSTNTATSPRGSPPSDVACTMKRRGPSPAISTSPDAGLPDAATPSRMD